MVITQADKTKIAAIMEHHGVLVGYLFGSAQRGTMGPFSDIDVAVLFAGAENIKQQEVQKEEIRDEISRMFRVESTDVIDLSRVADPLIKYIAVFSGELIFKKDERSRFALERKIIRDYEDTRELRRIAGSIMRRQLNDGTFGRISKIS